MAKRTRAPGACTEPEGAGRGAAQAPASGEDIESRGAARTGTGPGAQSSAGTGARSCARPGPGSCARPGTAARPPPGPGAEA